MKILFLNYSRCSSRKKKIIILLLIINFIVMWKCTSKYIVKKTIFDYMDRRGILRKDIVVKDFMKDLKYGGYVYDVAIKGGRSRHIL